MWSGRYNFVHEGTSKCLFPKGPGVYFWSKAMIFDLLWIFKILRTLIFVKSMQLEMKVTKFDDFVKNVMFIFEGLLH